MDYIHYQINKTIFTSKNHFKADVTLMLQYFGIMLILEAATEAR